MLRDKDEGIIYRSFLSNEKSHLYLSLFFNFGLMSELKAEHAIALQILMNEDLYLIDKIESFASVSQITETVANTDRAEPSFENTDTAFDYLGENNKYFAILVNNPAHQYMGPKELEALQSILGAKKMDLKDVAILNLHKYPQASFNAIKKFLVSNRMVLFGINPQTIQIPTVPSNQVSDYNGVKVLATYAFSEMMTDVEKKKAFWNAMKNL